MAAAGEGFQIEELIFDESMHRFDIALIGVGCRGNAQVLAVAQSGGETRAMALRIVAADEFAAVVGLPGQIAQVHAPTIQVPLNASGEDGAGRRRAFLGEGPEQQTAAHFPRRVFDPGQTQALGLGPELRNIAQILGIGGDLLEQAPGGFHCGQVLLALILFPALGKQAVFAPDALDGHMRNGEIELSFQTGRSKGGQPAAQCQDLLLDLGRGLVRAMAMSAAVFSQPGRPVLLKATQPFPYRWHRGGKGSGGGFDPVLARVRH
ncbi:MAG TPA: hypothetical protein VEU96_08060 [Bryobacteraceae bacterium]|nr:hypothetical protein [Bryobacteraceae bacterium]